MKSYINKPKIKLIQNNNDNDNINEIKYPLTRKINLSEKFSKNNMLVAVRARPLTKSELEDSNFNTISVPEKDKITVTIPTEYIPDDKSNIYLAGDQIKIIKVKEVSYKYDFVFNENATQDEIYRCTTSSLITQVVSGYSATILAYGATGSGKTYTMVGSGEKCGLMIRSIRELFNIIGKERDKLYSIKICYVEVYNEVLKDLLSVKNKSPPELRSDPIKGVVLQGAENKVVNNEEEAFNLINLGNKRRTEKQTERNKVSSRSHAVLQIYLEIQNQSNNINNLQNDGAFGKLILVDLAGSEKTSSNIKSNAETGSINKSLLALSKCINLLVTGNKKFIPFRESKLTRILQEPLSGNARIVMIATVSPAITNFDETMFTLQFANRSRSMKVNVKKNMIEPDQQLVKKYLEYIDTLKEQIKEVQQDIDKSGNVSMIEETKDNNDEINEKLEQFKKDMINHFKEEVNLKKNIIEEENKIEGLKNDISSIDSEMVHKPKVNLEYLKSELENKKKQINEMTEKVNKEYIKENELQVKRKQIQISLNDLNITYSGNILIKNMYNILKYYINLLDNMANEHRKNKNINEIKRKENKISLLTEQLNLRDLFIQTAKNDLKKNNIKFEFKNPKFETKEEIDLDPYNPNQLNGSPSYNSFKNENLIDNSSNNPEIEKINLSLLNNLKRNNRFNEINSFRKQVNQNVIKRNKSNFNGKKILISAGEKAIQNINNDDKKTKIDPIKKQNYFIENYITSDNNKSASVSKNEKKYVNISSNISSHQINPMEITTRLENEVQKKVKTILKKDFLGRYKNSPYLHLLND